MEERHSVSLLLEKGVLDILLGKEVTPEGDLNSEADQEKLKDFNHHCNTAMSIIYLNLNFNTEHRDLNVRLETQKFAWDLLK